jgi:hypothetical protein
MVAGMWLNRLLPRVTVETAPAIHAPEPAAPDDSSADDNRKQVPVAV